MATSVAKQASNATTTAVASAGPAVVADKPVVLVVGIDFSSTSSHLLQTARDLARAARRVELHVVHAMPVQRISPGLVDALPRASRSISAEVQSAHEALDALCAPIVAGLDAVVTTHVRAGRAVDEIPRLAAEVSADVIVVEAHGRTGLRRLFHHSLAADLARNAPCSVLTVRPKTPAMSAAPYVADQTETKSVVLSPG